MTTFDFPASRCRTLLYISFQSTDFAAAAEAAKFINDWVEKKTKEKIKDLIKEDMLGADVMMVLVNAVYFKGEVDFVPCCNGMKRKK
jgi:serine protease inhibitor